MKHIALFLIFSHLLLLAAPGFAKQDLKEEMQIAAARNNSLIGSKGSNQGVQVGDTYDIVKDGRIIGVAIVRIVKKNNCGLNIKQISPGHSSLVGDRLVFRANTDSDKQDIFAEMEATTLPEKGHAIQNTQSGCADGERQAQSDISGGTWFAIGCLAGLIGYLIALSEPNPPAMQLMGKSPEYVAAYTDCYRNKGKSIKSKNALYGCLVGTGATVVIYAIIIAAASNQQY